MPLEQALRRRQMNTSLRSRAEVLGSDASNCQEARKHPMERRKDREDRGMTLEAKPDVWNRETFPRHGGWCGSENDCRRRERL